MTATSPPTEARTLRDVARLISTLLPDDWRLSMVTEPAGRGRADAVGRLRGPDGTAAPMVFQVKRALTARDASTVVAQLRASAERNGKSDAVLVAAAPYLSPTTREVLTDLGVSYVDTTGNVTLRSRRPALLIKTEGATRDPWPSDETLQSLRGRGAGRAVRALLDVRPPYGLRDLSERAKVPLASLSRTTDLLDRDGFIVRAGRGPITDIDWQGVIRRWARDYDIARSNRVSTFLEPRGFTALSTKLSKLKRGYAVTGAFAAQRFSPVAPTRLAAMYVRDVVSWADRLDLRPADAGANVWLLEPFDEVVFARTSLRDGVVCVNPTQLAVDLLTGPGRDPSEGDELLTWMKGNEDAWRTR